MTDETEKKPDVGETRKQTQEGSLPIGTVKQILDAAPRDLVEEVVPVPEWGLSVKVRSATAAQSATIKQRGFAFKGEEQKVSWAEMEVIQFQMGVVEPRFSETEVRKLHATSGRGFQRVINWLDENSGIKKEELSKAQDEFQESQKSDEG